MSTPPPLPTFDNARTTASTTVCHPHVASWRGCFYGGDAHHYEPMGKPYKYPTLDVFGGGYTWPFVFYSGAITSKVAQDIVEMNAEYGAWTINCPRPKGQWPGMCLFSQIGHGYGMILYDMVERYLIFAFAMAAHGQTPGTWTAAECFSYDRVNSLASG